MRATTKGTTRFFISFLWKLRKTHTVATELAIGPVRFSGRNSYVAIRGSLGRDTGLWRRADDERYPCGQRSSKVLGLLRRGIDEL